MHPEGSTAQGSAGHAITPVRPAPVAVPDHVGQVANRYAAQSAFADYRSRKADNTLRAQDADLATFAAYLGQVGVQVDPQALATDPAAWQGMTWGLVKGFVAWMLKQGYAVGTVNRKLSTVKVYARLAAQAGALDTQELALIRSVQGYGRQEAKRVDERREQSRLGAKKAEPVGLTAEQAQLLKTSHPDTPQGRRDALLMCLLLDHGLRVGEIAALEVTDFNLAEGVFTFYRPKVDMEQTHRLTPDALRAARAWFESGDAPAMGPLLRGSRKGGALTEAGMSERAITARVRALGRKLLGIDGLSAHDCRHYWATRAAAQGTDAFALRDAGGWSSLAMPSRYVEAAAIANERVRL